MTRAEVIRPEDWSGPLHERPGLFARRDNEAEDAEETAALVVPPPEVLNRPAAADELATGAKSVIKACTVGWSHTETYARGSRVRGKREDGHTVKFVETLDSIVVRFSHASGARAMGMWVGGKFDNALTWIACRDEHCDRAGLGEHPGSIPAEINATELRALVTDPDPIEEPVGE